MDTLSQAQADDLLDWLDDLAGGGGVSVPAFAWKILNYACDNGLVVFDTTEGAYDLTEKGREYRLNASRE